MDTKMNRKLIGVNEHESVFSSGIEGSVTNKISLALFDYSVKDY